MLALIPGRLVDNSIGWVAFGESRRHPPFRRVGLEIARNVQKKKPSRVGVKLRENYFLRMYESFRLQKGETKIRSLKRAIRFIVREEGAVVKVRNTELDSSAHR